SLGLKEYELVAYHAEAKDNNTLDGPGIGVSPVYFIEITSEEGAQAKGKPKSEEGQQLNLLVVQKQIIADTTALGANAGSNQFEDLASRQKEATDFAQAYQQSLSTSGAPAEAAKLMDEVVGAMKSASTTLKERKRDAALPPEEKALAGLYQILKLLPKLGNFPTQPPPPTEQEKQEPAVSVALQAIKKQKPEAASNEELAAALEEAKQLSHSQADLLPAMDQRGHTPENGAQAA